MESQRQYPIREDDPDQIKSFQLLQRERFLRYHAEPGSEEPKRFFSYFFHSHHLADQIFSNKEMGIDKIRQERKRHPFTLSTVSSINNDDEYAFSLALDSHSIRP